MQPTGLFFVACLLEQDAHHVTQFLKVAAKVFHFVSQLVHLMLQVPVRLRRAGALLELFNLVHDSRGLVVETGFAQVFGRGDHMLDATLQVRAWGFRIVLASFFAIGAIRSVAEDGAGLPLETIGFFVSALLA